MKDIRTGPEFIKPLKSNRENDTNPQGKAGPQIYFQAVFK